MIGADEVTAAVAALRSHRIERFDRSHISAELARRGANPEEVVAVLETRYANEPGDAARTGLVTWTLYGIAIALQALLADGLLAGRAGESALLRAVELDYAIGSEFGAEPVSWFALAGVDALEVASLAVSLAVEEDPGGIDPIATSGALMFGLRAGHRLVLDLGAAE